MILISSTNDDYDLNTSAATVFSSTVPRTSRCELVVRVGDGTKDLEGSGSNLTVVVTNDGQVVGGVGQEVEAASGNDQVEFTIGPLRMTSGDTLAVTLESDNASDTDVDVTVEWIDIDAANREAGVLYVDGTNGSDSYAASCLGTKDYPYATASAVETAIADDGEIYFAGYDYADGLDLSGKRGVRVYGSRDVRLGGDVNLGTGCICRGITIGQANLTVACGVTLSGDGSAVIDCYAWNSDTNGDAVTVTGDSCRVIGNTLYGQEDGILVTGDAVTIECNTVDMDGNHTDCDVPAIYLAGRGAIIRHNVLRSYRKSAGDASHRAMGIGLNAGATDILIEGNSIFADADNGDEAYAYGIYLSDSGNSCMAVNNQIRTLASANAYDLFVEAGTLYNDGNGYSTSSGTITHVPPGAAILEDTCTTIPAALALLSTKKDLDVTINGTSVS